MKKTIAIFLFGILFSLFVQGVSAQELNGIRVESNAPVEVFVNGAKVCNPVHSCMITNLISGDYLVEVFAARLDAGYSSSKLLFRETIYYSGDRLKDIFVDSGEDYPRDFRPDFRRTMDEETFDDFLRKIEKAPFDKEKISMIELAIPHSWFYTYQVEELARLFTFDSERLWLLKKMYPSVIDKERTFVLLDLLSFSSSKNELKQYIRGID